MKEQELSQELRIYQPLIEALVKLFHPFVEVAVHDLKAGKIVALYHNISQRKVGDPTPLQELRIETSQFPAYFEPYYKRNWDGRPLKCTSITIRDQQQEAIGLICFNVDTRFFQEARQLLNVFLNVKDEGENPIELFGGDSQEQIQQFIQHYLHEHHLALSHLNRQQKKEMVLYLYAKGIFNYKNAIPSVAQYLKLSRASIYNYLKGLEES
ncbi:helix-turn-helix transcriptional regulator [Candidatus Protochlamydia phocaeensis]|uniref:helix-turn-helix transcriptional regulator n=1 Tax=Candidatus Protochlamydia phocaeensis TaxID=1414722 RepID=UPI000837FD72|nr:PAS domain-containing protein [Candidatus Protochlamydia phocaeensis]